MRKAQYYKITSSKYLSVKIPLLKDYQDILVDVLYL